jgi:ABC-type uncharacterized transport system permease subunit
MIHDTIAFLGTYKTMGWQPALLLLFGFLAIAALIFSEWGSSDDR